MVQFRQVWAGFPRGAETETSNEEQFCRAIKTLCCSVIMCCTIHSVGSECLAIVDTTDLCFPDVSFATTVFFCDVEVVTCRTAGLQWCTLVCGWRPAGREAALPCPPLHCYSLLFCFPPQLGGGRTGPQCSGTAGRVRSAGCGVPTPGAGPTPSSWWRWARSPSLVSTVWRGGWSRPPPAPPRSSAGSGGTSQLPSCTGIINTVRQGRRWRNKFLLNSAKENQQHFRESVLAPVVWLINHYDCSVLCSAS